MKLNKNETFSGEEKKNRFYFFWFTNLDVCLPQFMKTYHGWNSPKSSEKFPLSERSELGSLGFVRFVYNLQNNKKKWFKIRHDTAWVVSPTPNWLRPVQSFPSARRGALYDLEWLQLAHNQLTQLASLTAAGGEREKVIYATLCDPLINPSRVFQRRRGRY